MRKTRNKRMPGFIGKMRNIEISTSIGEKGNIGKLGKLCWGNEDKDLTKVLRCMILNAHV